MSLFKNRCQKVNILVSTYIQQLTEARKQTKSQQTYLYNTLLRATAETYVHKSQMKATDTIVYKSRLKTTDTSEHKLLHKITDIFVQQCIIH